MANPASKRLEILARRGLAVLCLVLALLSGTILSGGRPVAADGWVVECVDCPHYFDRLTDHSLRLDDAGHPHVAYGEDHLYYAWHDGSQWHIQVVDADPGADRNASLALDAAGYAHISYFDARYGRLRYAHQDPTSGVWQTETVDEGFAALSISLAVSPSGEPHIAYNPHGSIQHAYRDRAGWHVEVIESGTAGFGAISLALDRNNRPHVSYYMSSYDNWDIRYAYRDLSGWHVQVVDEYPGSEGGDTSLALDAYNRPHVSYLEDAGEAYNKITYATNAGSGWVRETVEEYMDEEGGHTSLALDAAGRPRISYYDYNWRRLRYAQRDSGSWEIETVDPNVSHAFPSLAMDTVGIAHIVYFDANGYLLEHAVQVDNEWQIETVDQAGAAGLSVSLKLDGLQRPHIGYRDSARNEFRYAVKAGGLQGVGDWVTEKVAGAGNKGWDVSLAVDDAGSPHMAYYYQTPDVSTQRLEYAYRDAAGWHTEKVRSAYLDGSLSLALAPDGQPRLGYSETMLMYAWRTPSGWQSELALVQESSGVSLALTAAGQPRLAYYDTWNNRVLFAYNDGIGWSVETVETDTGQHSGRVALALDASGNPHVSFFVLLLNAPALQYAFHDGAGWHVETVDNGAFVGSASIAVGADGVPRIAYSYTSDDLQSELRYASRGIDGWLVDTVPTGEGRPRNVSLALDGDDLPHIGFYDATTRDLKYARYIVLDHRTYLPLVSR
ncbi:MAG: hypothetical protein P8129_20895 [Anaerolineae bacterium]|jgi:hypothetical protein